VTEALTKQLIPQVEVGIKHNDQPGPQRPDGTQGDGVLASKHHREPIDSFDSFLDVMETRLDAAAIYIAYIA
jgi:hypothetical protein